MIDKTVDCEASESGCTALRLLKQAFDTLKDETIKDMKSDLKEVKEAVNSIKNTMLTSSVMISLAVIGWLVSLIIKFIKP